MFRPNTCMYLSTIPLVRYNVLHTVVHETLNNHWIRTVNGVFIISLKWNCTNINIFHFSLVYRERPFPINKDDHVKASKQTHVGDKGFSYNTTWGGRETALRIAL